MNAILQLRHEDLELITTIGVYQFCEPKLGRAPFAADVDERRSTHSPVLPLSPQLHPGYRQTLLAMVVNLVPICWPSGP